MPGDKVHLPWVKRLCGMDLPVAEHTLEYYTDRGPRNLQVVVLHWHDHDDDTFSVYRAADGACVGSGDTLEEAWSDAMIFLHQAEDFGIPIQKGWE
jgi:hypothetical protein